MRGWKVRRETSGSVGSPGCTGENSSVGSTRSGGGTRRVRSRGGRYRRGGHGRDGEIGGTSGAAADGEIGWHDRHVRIGRQERVARRACRRMRRRIGRRPGRRGRRSRRAPAGPAATSTAEPMAGWRRNREASVPSGIHLPVPRRQRWAAGRKARRTPPQAVRCVVRRPPAHPVSPRRPASTQVPARDGGQPGPAQGLDPRPAKHPDPEPAKHLDPGPSHPCRPAPGIALRASCSHRCRRPPHRCPRRRGVVGGGRASGARSHPSLASPRSDRPIAARY